MRALQKANLAIYVVECGSSQMPEIAQLAQMTGGRIYFADLNKALNDAISDLPVSYQVSWEPRGIQKQPLHKIELSSNEPLLFPSVYVELVLPNMPTLRIEAAEAGLATPLSTMAIRVMADIKSHSNGAMSVEVSIDPKDVVSLENDKPRVSALIDVLYALYDENGIRHKISGSKMSSFLERPVKQLNAITVPPEAYSLRVLVRDPESGAMGSANVVLNRSR